MTDAKTDPNTKPDLNALVEQMRRARRWAWGVLDNRIPGASRDLAWALIGLARDHDPETYSPWLRVEASDPERLSIALDLAADIARVITKADKLQPNLIRDGELGQ